MQDENMAQLTAALNGHELTDDNGAIQEETTSFENSVTQETNTVEETASPEKGAEPEQLAPKADDDGTETELAEDETGNRYVPEKRFKEVYGKQKALERELEQYKSRATASQPNQPELPNTPRTAPDIETELLYVAMPQFNPESEQYNQKLDRLGAIIYKANPGITKTEAARQAIREAKELTSDQAQVIAEARQVKTQTADPGITSRVINRQSKQVDPESMSLKEKEEYLKATGEWDKF